MYIHTYCRNQKRKSGENTRDENNCPYIFCKLTDEICVAQRWCPEQKKHIISERAKNICKKFEE